MPEFMEKFCDNMKEDFLERKDALIAKLDETKQERDIVHIDLNKVEKLYVKMFCQNLQMHGPVCRILQKT